MGGLGISYAGFGFRSVVSATLFTLTGIMCKIATVAMSQLFFENNASMYGIACLGLCVAGATFYRPSADRSTKTNATIEELQRLKGTTDAQHAHSGVGDGTK